MKPSRKNPLPGAPFSALHAVIPGEEPEGVEFVRFYTMFNMVAAPVAALVSYARNKDVTWALVHGFIGAPYLAYVALDIVSQEEGKVLWTATHEDSNG